jgi:hypothetical protein
MERVNTGSSVKARRKLSRPTNSGATGEMSRALVKLMASDTTAGPITNSSSSTMAGVAKAAPARCSERLKSPRRRLCRCGVGTRSAAAAAAATRSVLAMVI